MESGKGGAPEMTVPGAPGAQISFHVAPQPEGTVAAVPGAQSSYHVAPQSGNSESAMQVVPYPVAVAGAVTEKKKRGRPRKYLPGDSSSSKASTMPLSSSAPPATGKSYTGEERPSVSRSVNTEKKHKNKVGAEKLDDLVDCSTGSCFAPHVLTINEGEDIMSKITEFAVQGPRSVCVVSASGTVSHVTIRHPVNTGDTLRYEGLFEILTFSGSFTPADLPDSHLGRSGLMSISLSGNDGRVIGGVISGMTIAASPVKATIVSFLQPNLQDPKPKKQKPVAMFSTDMADPSAAHTPMPEKPTPSTVLAPNCSTSHNAAIWAPTGERPTKTADINIPLQRG